RGPLLQLFPKGNSMVRRLRMNRCPRKFPAQRFRIVGYVFVVQALRIGSYGFASTALDFESPWVRKKASGVEDGFPGFRARRQLFVLYIPPILIEGKGYLRLVARRWRSRLRCVRRRHFTIFIPWQNHHLLTVVGGKNQLPMGGRYF